MLINSQIPVESGSHDMGISTRDTGYRKRGEEGNGDRNKGILHFLSGAKTSVIVAPKCHLDRMNF